MKSVQSGSERYLNREHSWLQFNRRVLEEARNPDNPLLERLKFLAIFESNLDEFYMVRVSGLFEQLEGGVVEASPDGLTPSEQLQMIAEVAGPLRAEAGALLQDHLLPELAQNGIRFRSYRELTPKQKEELNHYFRHEIFPLCTPVSLSPATTPPFISNRSLNILVEALDEQGAPRILRVKVPNVAPRATPIPRRKNEFVLLEEIIAANFSSLFPGVPIQSWTMFRVLRDADIEIRELDAADLIGAIEQSIKLRRYGDPVLLECASDMGAESQAFLMEMLSLDESDVIRTDGILALDFLFELLAIEAPALRYRPFKPFVADFVATPGALFERVLAEDVLVQQPFDSFRSVETFVGSAALDPQVIGIKQTLYRVGAESPIVESLLAAAEDGKQVAAMVELKARFDESNNLVWARALERAGVHVSYGFPEMKTHCKLSLIVRREHGSIETYAHIGTGNYNPVTARQYTDLGLFTSDTDITQDIIELFNYLTGYSRQTEYRKLLVAPLNLRERIVELIAREAEFARKKGEGRLIFKLNALVDPEVIDAIYEASQAGVQVDLIVRGVCCLRPGVPGLSDNVRVISVVGRFLEHSRVYWFGAGGSPEAYIGSADMMRRNLDRRIEVLAPLERTDLIKLLKDEVLELYLRDNQKAWRLNAQGTYERITPKRGEKAINAQEALIARPLSRLQN